MMMTGMYRIALLPGADEKAFVSHMQDEVFKDPNALQSTRNTRGFQHQLLKVDGNLRQYCWQATADLQTNAGYDFAQEAQVQKWVQDFGVLIGVESYTHV